MQRMMHLKSSWTLSKVVPPHQAREIITVSVIAKLSAHHESSKLCDPLQLLTFKICLQLHAASLRYRTALNSTLKSRTPARDICAGAQHME